MGKRTDSLTRNNIFTLSKNASLLLESFMTNHTTTRVTDYALNKYINTKTSLYCTIPTIKKMFTPEVDVENEAIPHKHHTYHRTMSFFQS